MNAISAFLFFDRAHVLESLEIIISGRFIFGTLLDQGRIRSPSAIVIQHQSFDRTFGIPRMAPSFSRDVHSHFLSLFLSLSSVHLRLCPALTLPLPFQSNPHLCICVRGSRRITASSRGRLALSNNHHGPNVLSSPPANQANPINALGRPQTKKSPPGTHSRVRHVFVLKCPFCFGHLHG